MKSLTLLTTYLAIFSFSFAQNYTTAQKGDMYMLWGWNRSAYTASDIRFYGNDYDFTLSNVVANDRQSPFDWATYFRPDNISLPQTNFRIGYFLNEKYNISAGVDHMKYVMEQDQYATIDGYINKDDSPYNGVYEGDGIQLTDDFLIFEHTDGLNYLNVEISRLDPLASFSIKQHQFGINLTEGIGAGALMPKTNATLLGGTRNDEFHLAGWGASAKLGLNVRMFKYVYLQSEAKLGYINMQDIYTTPDPSDIAQQDFWFIQGNIMVGVIIPTKKKTKL